MQKLTSMLLDNMVTLFLFGDSTCQTNLQDTYPQHGWGQVIPEYLNEDVRVINLARNGRSTKSFITEERYEPALRNIKKGDFLFIQFGHNDEKEDEARKTDPWSTYQDNLRFFISIARNVGATPVLISSIYRRKFVDGKLVDNCHLDFPSSMEALAKKENVIYIDGTKLTKDALNKIGEKESRKFFMNFDPNIYENYPEGKEDNTHLRYEGAKFVCDLIVPELKKHPELAKLFK